MTDDLFKEIENLDALNLGFSKDSSKDNNNQPSQLPAGQNRN